MHWRTNVAIGGGLRSIPGVSRPQSVYVYVCVCSPWHGSRANVCLYVREMSARVWPTLRCALYPVCTSAPILLYVRLPYTQSGRETQLVVGFDFPVASRYVGLASTSPVVALTGKSCQGLVRGI